MEEDVDDVGAGGGSCTGARHTHLLVGSQSSVRGCGGGGGGGFPEGESF